MTEAGNCYKCCCKYLSMIYKQNYINILIDNENKGLYASNSTYLHITKITSSDIQQEAEQKIQKRNAKYSDRRWAALTDILHIMLRYPEVFTDLIFVSICTIPLELCVANNIHLDAENNDDGFFVTSI